MKREGEMEEKMVHISARNFSYIILGIIAIAIIIIGTVVLNSENKIKTDSQANIPAAETPASNNTPAPNPIPAIQNTDKVVILSDTMDIDKANIRHKTISGRVQNTGSVQALSVEITALLYDLNGTQIGKEMSRPLRNDLHPGEISWFYIEVYDSYDTSTAAYRLTVSSQ